MVGVWGARVERSSQTPLPELTDTPGSFLPENSLARIPCKSQLLDNGEILFIG